MIAGLLFFLQTAAASPAASPRRQTDSVPVSPKSVEISSPKQHATVKVTTLNGISVVPGDKLAAALGGTFKMTSPGHYSLTVGEAHVSFTDGIPFAGSDSTIVPMTSAPHVVGQTVYLPFFVVAELVPRFFTGFFYDAEHGEVRAFNTAARTVAQAPVPSADQSAKGGTDSAADAVSTTRSPSTARRGGRRLVVVDAGHGGPDNGMTGPIGGSPKIREKNITLAVAKLVAQSLRDAGVEVLMTRTTDTLIALSDRGRIANRNHGDVFVSVHVNATGSRGRDAARERGFETYFLAEAKSEDARRVEKMENEAVKFETGANAPKGDPLSFILNDMAQNEHLRESAELARIIQDDFKSFHPGPSRGVQQANFAVLRGSYMPAVLVEIGFGTNPQEAAYLTDADNERTIARSIAKSVLSYLGRYDARVGGGE